MSSIIIMVRVINSYERSCYYYHLPGLFHPWNQRSLRCQVRPEAKSQLPLPSAPAKNRSQEPHALGAIRSHLYLECSSVVSLTPTSGGLTELLRNSSLCLLADCNLQDTRVSAKRCVRPLMSHQKLLWFLSPHIVLCGFYFSLDARKEKKKKQKTVPWCQE